MVSGRLRGILTLLTVFALGGVVGGASVFAVIEHRSASRLLDDRLDERRLEILTSRLALDGEQRRRIAGILNDAQGEARSIAHDMDSRCGHPLIEHRGRVDERIRAALRPPQQATFDELLAQRRAREEKSGDPLSP